VEDARRLQPLAGSRDGEPREVVEERLPAREVPVDGRSRDAGRRRDLTDTRFPPLRREDARRGLQDRGGYSLLKLRNPRRAFRCKVASRLGHRTEFSLSLCKTYMSYS
jgi:hypothetical protein